MVYQAFSRGSCRYIDDGKARRMTGYLIHRDDQIRKVLDRVMPGARWEEWVSETGVRVGVIATLAKRIADHLDGLPQANAKVSTRKLKVDMGVTDVAPQTWRHAVARYLEDGPEWLPQGRSLVRASALFDV